jgi:predicted  nucleic acid-binding Zn-ribbon protein
MTKATNKQAANIDRLIGEYLAQCKRVDALNLELREAQERKRALRDQLGKALREAGFTREQATPAVNAFVSAMHGTPLNDKGTLENLRDAGGVKATRYEAAKKDRSRILASLAEPTDNKVDPVEAEIKAFYRALDSLSAKAKKQIALERGYKF